MVIAVRVTEVQARLLGAAGTTATTGTVAELVLDAAEYPALFAATTR
jgi:hypothetical protein